MASDDEYTTWIKVDMLNNPFTGGSGVVIPRIAGLISIISSALIINIILQSTTRLSSTYHRIMMAMSIYDIIGSAAVALTTLPFPKDDMWVNLYNYGGVRLGTYATCTAQGFLHIFGSLGTHSYSMVLSVYYACAIALSMEARKIERYVEPGMHLFATVISASVSLDILFHEGYNPNPRRTFWCTMTPLPYSCLELSSLACERGTKKYQFYMVDFFNITSAVYIIIHIVSLSAVCAKVTKLYIETKKSRRDHVRMTEQPRADLDTLFWNARATFVHAISYVVALVITILPILIGNMMPGADNTMFRLLGAVTVPLQGLFNFVIFVGAKIYHLRRTDSEISFKDALRDVMFRTSLGNDVNIVVLTGLPAAPGARSSRLPSSLIRSMEEEQHDCSNIRVSVNESRDMTLSVGAWDANSWISQSEIGSRGNQSNVTPEALSRNSSFDLSPRNRHIENLYDELSAAS